MRLVVSEQLDPAAWRGSPLNGVLIRTSSSAFFGMHPCTDADHVGIVCCRPELAVSRLYASAAGIDHLVRRNLLTVPRTADHDRQRAGLCYRPRPRECSTPDSRPRRRRLPAHDRRRRGPRRSRRKQGNSSTRTGVVAADVYAHGSTMSSRPRGACAGQGSFQDRLLGAARVSSRKPEKASNLAIASKICPASSPRGGGEKTGPKKVAPSIWMSGGAGLKACDLMASPRDWRRASSLSPV